MAAKVLILGDSTLAGLGGHFENAVDLLQAKARFASRLELSNLSAAGMTAADAWTHFKEQSARRELDAVVVYVGNCDACSFGLQKAWAPFGLAGPVTRWLNGRRRANPLARRSEPLQFAAYASPPAEVTRCVSPRDYARFIGAILARAERKRIKVILFNPAPKRRFPPCNNTGNFAFYKIAGVEDRHAYRGDEREQSLIRALELHGAGSLGDALAAYEEIIAARAGEESAWIAANNAAAIHFREGRSDAALRLLDSIPERGNPLHPLVVFNQAVIRDARGEEQEARALFASAAESDSGTYRTTAAHRDALDRVARASTADLWYVDVDQVLSDADFADYCHPNPGGHERLYRELRSCLEEALELRPGNERPVVECAPANPDRFAGERSDLFHHLGVVRAPDPSFPRELLARAGSDSYGDVLVACGDPRSDARERTRLRILAHPLFGSASFLAASPPTERVDQGSLPELYFMRHMLALHAARSERGSPGAAFDEVDEILPKPQRVASWWPGLGVSEADLERVSRIARELDFEAIARRAEQRFGHSLEREPVVFSRYRTITYWFMRESMVFGSTSHYSMYFDRSSLLDVLDACLFALESLGSGGPLAERFRNLVLAAGDALRVHRKHLVPVAHQVFRLDPAAFARYRDDLERISPTSALATSRFASGV